MHIFHCWHHVEGSRRKLKSNSKCKENDPYIANGCYIKYKMIERCCICGKTRETLVYRDYDIQRGLTYPDYE